MPFFGNAYFVSNFLLCLRRILFAYEQEKQCPLPCICIFGYIGLVNIHNMISSTLCFLRSHEWYQLTYELFSRVILLNKRKCNCNMIQPFDFIIPIFPQINVIDEIFKCSSAVWKIKFVEAIVTKWLSQEKHTF